VQLFILQILCEKGRPLTTVCLPMSAFVLFQSNNSHSDKTKDFHNYEPIIQGLRHRFYPFQTQVILISCNNSVRQAIFSFISISIFQCKQLGMDFSYMSRMVVRTRMGCSASMLTNEKA